MLQVLFGFLVPGSARANVIAVMLCNTVVSQSVGILSDYKTALYLQVRPRSMFYGQLLGAAIGVLVSSSVFLFVLFLNDTNRIKLGTAEWPAVSAVSQTLNAKIFGEQGPSAGKGFFWCGCTLGLFVLLCCLCRCVVVSLCRCVFSPVFVCCLFSCLFLSRVSSLLSVSWPIVVDRGLLWFVWFDCTTTPSYGTR